jgi:hypothetical protein
VFLPSTTTMSGNTCLATGPGSYGTENRFSVLCQQCCENGRSTWQDNISAIFHTSHSQSRPKPASGGLKSINHSPPVAAQSKMIHSPKGNLGFAQLGLAVDIRLHLANVSVKDNPRPLSINF